MGVKGGPCSDRCSMDDLVTMGHSEGLLHRIIHGPLCLKPQTVSEAVSDTMDNIS